MSKPNIKTCCGTRWDGNRLAHCPTCGDSLAASTCSAWDYWSAEELEREILDRVMHFYADMDGNPVFPNSAEGDLLKLTYHFFKKQNEGSDAARSD